MYSSLEAEMDGALVCVNTHHKEEGVKGFILQINKAAKERVSQTK